MQGHTLFHPVAWEIPRSQLFRSDNLSAAIQSCGLQDDHGLLYTCIYYTVSYAVWFVAFTDANEGLLSFIQDTVAMGGCRSEVVVLDNQLSIQVGETKIMQIPWGIMKEKKDC
jgi:hypothetical protein